MNIRGNGSICILECKVLFILQEIVPVSKGNVAPGWFFFFLSLFYKIAFCMSSLLLDCYLNGLSVCLVLVVDLRLTTLKCFFYDYLATSPLSPK